MDMQTYILLPTLLVVFGAIVMMMISAAESISIRKRSVISLLFLIPAFVINVSLLGDSFSYNVLPEYLNNIFVIDTFAVLLSSFLILGAILTILLGQYYYEMNRYFVTEYFPLLMFALFGMMMLVMSNELITLFVSLEIASVSIYVLVGLNKNTQRGSEALFKYLILGSFMGGFFLFGTVLIYAFSGTTYLPEIAQYINTHATEDFSLIIIGGTLIMITIMFKIAAFPFHSWSLDIYTGTSMPVTAFMASTFKMAIFAVALRIFLVDFSLIADVWDTLLVTTAIITLLAGSLLTLSQTNLKRMLVSSSIVHSGYLLIALASMGAGNYEGAPAIIFYLIAYFITAIGTFGLLSYIVAGDTKKVQYEDFKGLAYKRPLMAAVMSIFMLSFAGFPSTIGFLGKFYIFTAAIEAGYVYLAVLGVLAAFVSVYYYFKLIVMMYFYPASHDFAKRNRVELAPFIIGVLAFVVLWGGIGNMIIPFLPSASLFIEMAKLSIESLALH
jgi:NADH-quinone oxidoreductase subunit N